MKKLSYLIIGILLIFIGLDNVSAAFFSDPISITFYLNDSHNALNTRPEEWEFCFEDSASASYYKISKVCLKISNDKKVYSILDDSPIQDDVTQYVEFIYEKNEDSMDVYKLKFDWVDITKTSLHTQDNYKVTIKGISDNNLYNLVLGTPTNITSDTLNYTATFSLSGLKHIKGNITFNDENDRDGIREGLLSDFYLSYDGFDIDSLTSENFLRLIHDVYDSNHYTFEEYVAEYYYDEYGGNDFTRPITYNLKFFGGELKDDDIIVNVIPISGGEQWNITINHIPEKISPVKVKVNWLDSNSSKRPTSLSIDVIGNEGFIERTVELTDDNWETTLEDLFKNYKGEEINYSLKVNSVNNYTFTVIGNQVDGFVINAEYKTNTSSSSSHSSGSSNKTNNKEEVDKEELNNNKENIDNVEIPNTGDSIISI